MGPVATIVGALLLILLETVLLHVFGVEVLAPHLAVYVILYVTLRRRFDLAAGTTLLVAGVADLCSGGPRGYLALGLTVVFFLGLLVRLRWRPRHWLPIALFTAPAVLVCDITSHVTMAIFRGTTDPLSLLLHITPWSAFLMPFYALPLAWMALKLDQLFETRRSQRRM